MKLLHLTETKLNPQMPMSEYNPITDCVRDFTIMSPKHFLKNLAKSLLINN